MTTILKRNKWTISLVLLFLLATVSAVFISKANAENHQTKVIYVYSTSCHYCQKFSPTLVKVVPDFSDLQIEKINILESPANLERVKKLGAKVTPTLFIEKEGVVLERLEGVVDEQTLREFLQKARKLNTE